MFIGATADERFRAFNIEHDASYERDGRQYVVLAAGGHHIFYSQKVSDWLIAYALPEK